MSLTGLQVIGIGSQNESVGSDSLYEAFTKTKNNFNTLFTNASPYNTFTGGTGTNVTANATSGTVTITNTGVTSLTAGDSSINLTSSNGAITITATGGNGSGSIGSVGLVPVSTGRLVVTNSPLVTSGNLGIDLATTGVTAGAYVYPSLTVDQYGRISTITSGASVGTVTSLSVTPGPGIQVTGSPVTTSGTINIINTGVTKLSAGVGMAVSSSNGEVTISTTLTGGTVTSVGISSNSLVVTGGAITTTGSIAVNLPTNMSITGNITGGNLLSAGRLVMSGSQALANTGAVSLTTTATYFTPSADWVATMAAGSEGQIKTLMKIGAVGTMTITVTNAGWSTGLLYFSDQGAACTMQYVNGKWYRIGNNGVADNNI